MARRKRKTPRRRALTQASRPSVVFAPRWWLTPVLATVLVLVTAWAYGPSFSGVLLLDDIRAIVRNQSITTLWPLSTPLSPPTESTVAGRPVANLSFAVNYALAPPDSRNAFNPAVSVDAPDVGEAFLRNIWGYHLGNLLIHILAGLALFGVIRRTLLAPRFGDRFAASSVWLGFAVALLWLLHPLQTSAVTYIVQRVESLMGLFVLLTLYCAIRSIESARHARVWAACAVVTCALGMGTKEVAIVTPVIVALWDWMFGSPKRFRVRWGLVAALAATWVVLAALLVSEHRGPSIDLAPYTVWCYLLTQSAVVTQYLRLAFVPSPLVFLYTWPLETSLAAVAGPFLLLASLIALSVAAVWRRHPAGFAGVLFFLVLAPTSSILPIVTEVAAEHRMYLPLAALLSLIVISSWWAAGKALSRVSIAARLPIPARRGLAVVVLVMVAVLYTVETRARNEDYQSETRIWHDTVDKQPSNPRARVAYGQALAAADRFADAEVQLRRAIDFNPRDPVALTRLGSVVAAQGRLDEATPFWTAALRLWPNDPDAHRFLAQAYAMRGQDLLAVRHYESVLAVVGGDPAVMEQLVMLLVGSADPGVRDPGRAMTLAEQAVRLTGRQRARSIEVLSIAQAATGRMSEALATAAEASALARAQGDSVLASQIEQWARRLLGP